MNNLDKAFEHINNNKFEVENISFKGKTIRLQINSIHAFEAAKIAATPNWKYQEKNEFPNEKQIVLGISKINQSYHLVTYDKEFKQFYKDDDFEIGILAWCELPVFNKA